MMYRDYYAYLQKNLDNSLYAIAQAEKELEEARMQRDDEVRKQARKQASKKLKKLLVKLLKLNLTWRIYCAKPEVLNTVNISALPGRRP